MHEACHRKGEMLDFRPASGTYPLAYRRSCLPGSLSGRTSRGGHQAREKACIDPAPSASASTLPSLAGVDLLSLDGLRAVRCLNATGSAAFAEVRLFLRVAKWVYEAGHMLRFRAQGFFRRDGGASVSRFGKQYVSILLFLAEPQAPAHVVRRLVTAHWSPRAQDWQRRRKIGWRCLAINTGQSAKKG